MLVVFNSPQTQRGTEPCGQPSVNKHVLKPSEPLVFCTTWNSNTGVLEFSERLWRTEWGGRVLFWLCNSLLVEHQARGSESLHRRLLPARPVSLHWCVQRFLTLPRRQRQSLRKVQGAAKVHWRWDVFLSLSTSSCLFSHWRFLVASCHHLDVTGLCVSGSVCLCAIYAAVLFTAGGETKIQA